MTFPGIWGEIIKKAFCFAVPIFYMITGYYAFAQSKTVRIKRLIKSDGKNLGIKPKMNANTL